VLTVMQRLRKKGYLARRTVGGVHRYSATVPQGRLLERLVGEFVDEVLGGSLSPLVAYLQRSAGLSEDERKKLEQMVKRIESREQGEES
jgi:predicted transcriptional regulator